MSDLDDTARRIAREHGLDDEATADFVTRVRARLRARIARAERPFKTCTGCGRDQPAYAFGEHSGRADGLQVRCRECRSRPETHQAQ